MKIIDTDIPDVKLIEPKVFTDDRGFFMETYQQRGFAEAGLPTEFVQDNHSGSRQGILRGLHYQLKQSQGKLVRVVVGEVFDVAVDLRKSSPTFGQMDRSRPFRGEQTGIVGTARFWAWLLCFERLGGIRL